MFFYFFFCINYLLIYVIFSIISSYFILCHFFLFRFWSKKFFLLLNLYGLKQLLLKFKIEFRLRRLASVSTN